MISCKQKTNILLILNVLLITLLALAQCTRGKVREKEIKRVSLVPFGLIKNAKQIILSSPLSASWSSQIKIIKKNDVYILQNESGYYYVKQDLMTNLFEALSQSYPSYIIANNYKNYAYYSLDEASSFNIRFVTDDKDILIDLYIGSLDATGERRYVRRGSLSSQILSVEDRISSFLTTENAFWVDMQPFKEKLKNNAILSVTRGDEKTIRDNDLESSFADLEDVFCSLTMIDIFDRVGVENEHTLRFTFGFEKGDDLTFSFTPLENGDYVFFDSSGRGNYILSGYSQKRFLQAINALFF